MDIAATSTEYLHVPVAAAAGVDITGTPVKVAVVAHNANPAAGDWKTAAWASGAARLLIGPASGALTLTAGTYWVWVTWTAGIETPVYRAGRIRIY